MLPMDEQPIADRPANLLRALKRGLLDAYDHLGYVILVSFLSFGGVLAFVAVACKVLVTDTLAIIPALVLLLFAGFFCYLCSAGTAYFVYKRVCHEHPSPADTLIGAKRLFLPALWIFLVDLLVIGFLVGDAVFFVSAEQGAISIVFGVLFLYAALIWLITATYHLPLLPVQLDMPSGPSPFVIIRKSFLLTFASPGFTVGLFLVIIALAVICAIPALVGTAIFFTGASAFILTHGLRELLVRHGVVEDEPEMIEDKGWPSG